MRPVRLSWARLLKRVFELDLEHCPNCGGELKIIAAILEHPVIENSIKPAPEMNASVDAGYIMGLGCVRSGDVERFPFDSIRADSASVQRNNSFS